MLLFETLKIYCLSYFVFLCALLSRSSSSLFGWKFNIMLRNHIKNLQIFVLDVFGVDFGVDDCFETISRYHDVAAICVERRA